MAARDANRETVIAARTAFAATAIALQGFEYRQLLTQPARIVERFAIVEHEPIIEALVEGANL